jgi:di/tricarboxylate transporter
VTAVFLGPVMGLARRIGVPPSRLLMPLAFAAILGGTCTLIGTSTNVAVSGAITKLGLEPLGMFEFTHVGLVVLVSGIAFMVLFGSKLVPERDQVTVSADALREYLAEVVVLPNSARKPLIRTFPRSNFRCSKSTARASCSMPGQICALRRGMSCW